MLKKNLFPVSVFLTHIVQLTECIGVKLHPSYFKSTKKFFMKRIIEICNFMKQKILFIGLFNAKADPLKNMMHMSSVFCNS